MRRVNPEQGWVGPAAWAPAEEELKPLPSGLAFPGLLAH